MRLLVLLLLLLLTLPLWAPDVDQAFIAEQEPIHYDPMLFAFMKVESNFRADVVNNLGYTGILQIGQEMIDEANRILMLHGKIQSCTLTDATDSTKSVRVWYIIQNHYNRSYTLENACRIWNPLGGELYYRRIKKAML